jgi:hypothetical protein
MSDENENLQKKLNSFKPKKKLSVPKEFLESANSYDEKLSVIRVVTEKEMKKVILLVKDMLKK